MNEHALTVKTIREGAVCTLILRGDLDLSEIGGFLERAALAVDARIERLVLDLAGVTFLDCTGVRALAMAASFAPSGCPVVVRSLSPMARRILLVLGLDLEQLGELSPGQDPEAGQWDGTGDQQELAPVESAEPNLDG